MKKAKVKERIDTICDLVDCFIDEEINQDQLVRKLLEVAGKPIIRIGDMDYRVTSWDNNLYLECRNQCIDGKWEDWVQVEDLTDWTIYEYNDLVSELHKHYPDYPIEHLEGRFV